MRRKFQLSFAAFFLGLSLQIAGAKLNWYVEQVNGGPMPVWVISDAIAFGVAFTPGRVPISKDTKLVVFTDVIPELAVAWGGQLTYAMTSFGDNLQWIGKGLYLFSFLIPFLRRKHEEVSQASKL